MGKTVVVIDLNPLSRTAQTASVTIVDELTRVVKNMIFLLESSKKATPIDSYDNQEIVRQSLDHILTFFES